MSFLRNHLSLILPLIALLFSLQLFIVIDRMVVSYENSLNDNYAIVIASENEIEQNDLENHLPQLKKLESVDPSQVLDKIRDEISATNMALLKISLPKFYRITLERYPDQEELNEIETILSEYQGIQQIETFRKTHDQMYQLLRLAKTLSQIFAVIVFLISFLLMTRQIQVWKFEHLERMEIMALFGAPYWMRTSLLFKMAFFDSIFSTAVVVLFFYWFSNNQEVESLFSNIGLNTIHFTPTQDSILLLGVSLVISIISVLMVIRRQRA